MGYLIKDSIILKKTITIPEADFLLLDTTPYLLLSLQTDEYCMLFGAACVFGNPGYYSNYQHIFINDGNNTNAGNIARFDESIVNSKTTINFALNQVNNFLGYTPSINTTTSLYLNSQNTPNVFYNGSVDIVLFYTILR